MAGRDKGEYAGLQFVFEKMKQESKKEVYLKREKKNRVWVSDPGSCVLISTAVKTL